MTAPSTALNGMYELLLQIQGAAVALYFAALQMPEQVDMNCGDWEQIRLQSPLAHVASTHLLGMPVQTWSGLRHGEFRLRLDGEVVVDSADLA